MQDSADAVVAVVVDEMTDYQRRVVRGMQDELAGTGVPLLVVVSHPRDVQDGQLLVRLLQTRRVRGLVVTALRVPATEGVLAAAAREAGVPVVGIARRLPGVPTVECDNRPGMRALMAHLLDEQGVRRPAFLRGDPGNPDSEQREAVFRAELAARGIPVDEALLVEGRFHHEPAFRAVSALLASGTQPDAVVAANDVMALAAVDALAAAGRRVPRDVRVTGFDDGWEADVVGITSVAQELEAQGRAAARLVLDLAAGRAAAAHARVGVRLPSRLVRRASSGAAVVERRRELEDGRGALLDRSSLDSALELSRAVSACTTVEEVVEELALRLTRLGLRQCFLVLDEAGERRLALAYVDGATSVPAPASRPVVPAERLLPAGLEERLLPARVVQVLFGHRGRHGYLVYDFDGESARARLSDVLQVDLSRALDALARERELQGYAHGLERLVSLRTRQLEAEVATRRAAEAELLRANAELERLSLVDELTGVANRRAFNAALQRAWDRCARHAAPLALVLCDVDRFKQFNDRYGHPAGDASLRAVAGVLRAVAVRGEDLPARYGGEEFALVLPATGDDGAATVAARLLDGVRRLGIEHADGVDAGLLSISAGWAVVHPVPRGEVGELVRAADDALYAAKLAGRATVVGAPLGAGRA
ncbi:diguanylate cyclase (GGDEF)-like protein [Motilibacter rhizosphaerae]|uniref:Diguanylate cyclase (GGDEF)-like protein n=1 Tax=Motilibacter rhizosphaerae TaxID=598652 RepID=A0A4Q7NGG2_9ACTN|nr:diguanylate cyclase [Motilibacter rhizosphaerae]RZS82912.1 diguanylate cyclase (GGDEF)-like protein [Motilibacter rhizosphaerae]